MSPLRIIIIVILIYLAYRLITGGRKPSVTQGRKKKPLREMPVSDTLEEDPVCKKLVPRQQAVEYEHQGKKIYFCSKKCCNIFRSKQGEHQ
ncbi:MAG: YHS domain-containing protein [Desulforhopalus sp.]|nr:YHS domain-containing protein [Desulforhopalus sp.]